MGFLGCHIFTVTFVDLPIAAQGRISNGLVLQWTKFGATFFGNQSFQYSTGPHDTQCIDRLASRCLS